jgi:hypothetical protein
MYGRLFTTLRKHWRGQRSKSIFDILTSHFAIHVWRRRFVKTCLFARAGLIATIEVQHRPWNIRGQLISAVTELGLHNRKETELPTSSLLSQFRKRTFAACFSLDKLMSTHVGRPPALSRHYYSTHNPLDFDDDQFAADPEQIQSTKQNLDDSGWDIVGNVYPSTYLRA